MRKPIRYFVTGIDTDSGKTVASAILCEALKADYWKPVQCGLPRDAEVINELISNPLTKVHPETHLLHTPASPHAAAKIDGVSITLADFVEPNSSNTLIIEGAGGCLVPLNDDNFVIDLIVALQSTAVLVADLYLGSINHTLLTIEALRKRKIPVKGIIFNGEANSESERIILKHSGFKKLLHIKKELTIDRAVVIKYAQLIKSNWDE